MQCDTYSQARGGWSRILEISCEKCTGHVCFYQKDGPGPLKRMYIDRMLDARPSSPTLLCPRCGHELGIKTVYAKENRLAYRLFQSAVHTKITKQSSINQQSGMTHVQHMPRGSS